MILLILSGVVIGLIVGVALAGVALGIPSLKDTFKSLTNRSIKCNHEPMEWLKNDKILRNGIEYWLDSWTDKYIIVFKRTEFEQHPSENTIFGYRKKKLLHHQFPIDDKIVNVSHANRKADEQLELMRNNAKEYMAFVAEYKAAKEQLKSEFYSERYGNKIT